MSEEAIAIASVALVGALLLGLPACAVAYGRGADGVRAEAIERGLGEWRVDQRTHVVEFHWTVKAMNGSVEVERAHPAASGTLKP